MPKVALIAYPNCYASGISTLQDILQIANHHWLQQYQTTQNLFETRVLSVDGRTVRTSSRMRILPDGDLSQAESCDIIVLPSLYYAGPAEFALTLESLSPLIHWLRRQHEEGKLILGYCTGTLLMAEAGLLEHGPATTNRCLVNTFRKRYPHIELKPQQLVIENKGVLCGSAANSEQLMALRLIERYMGPAVNALCAKAVLLSTNDCEQLILFTVENHQEHDNPVVSKAQSWMQLHMQERFSLEDLATATSVSTRTLIRHFKQVLNLTPNRYLQKLRISTAKKILENSSLPIETVMSQVGYVDLSSFSRLFHRETGLSPRAYRKQCRQKPNKNKVLREELNEVI